MIYKSVWEPHSFAYYINELARNAGEGSAKVKEDNRRDLADYFMA